MNITFSIREAFKEAWGYFKDNLGFLIIYQLIEAVLSAIFSVSTDSAWAPVWGFIGTLILALVHLGFYKVGLLITKGEKPGLDQLYANWRQLPAWLIASIIVGFFVFIALFVCIVPFATLASMQNDYSALQLILLSLGAACAVAAIAYIIVRYAFFTFFILDKDSGPILSLKQANELTKGTRWHVFLLIVVCSLLNILGALAFLIGLFITVPVTMLAMTVVYRKLTGQQQTEQTASSVENG